MLDLVTVNGVKIFNPIKGKENEIINYFVKFYGEKYRNIITDTIRKTTFIFTARETESTLITEQIEAYYSKEKDKMQKELFANVPFGTYSKNALPVSLNMIEKALQDLQNKNFHTFSLSLVVTDIINMYNIKNAETYSLNNMADWLNKEENYNNILDVLNHINTTWNTQYKPKLDLLETEVLKAKNEVIKYDGVIAKYKNLRNDALKKISREYLVKLNPEFNKLDTKKQERLINTFCNLVDAGSGEFISGVDFSFDAERKVELFNFLGFDKSNELLFDADDPIELYKRDKKLIEIIFNQEIINKFKAKEEETANNILKKNPYFLEALKTINTLNIRGGNDLIVTELLKYMYINEFVGAYVDFYVEDKTNDLKFLCVCSNALKLSDETLIHEINHIIETRLILSNERSNLVKCGFELLETHYTGKNFTFKNKQQKTIDSSYEENKRESEMLSEVVNDYLSLEVMASIKADGKKYCFGKNIGTTYSTAFPLFKNFIECHKEKIIETRMSDNPRAFINFVGVKNYYLLSQIAESYIYDYAVNGKIDRITQEIKDKTGIRVNTLERYKEYVNRKDITWSENTKKVLAYFRTVDEITESLTIGKETKQENIK